MDASSAVSNYNPAPQHAPGSGEDTTTVVVALVVCADAL